MQAQYTDFVHYFNLPFEFFANDVKQLSNGDYIVVGFVHTVNGGDYVIVKLDSNGNQLSYVVNNRFDGYFGDNGFRKVEIADGFIYAAGFVYNNPGQDRGHAYVAKFDTALNRIWEREYILNNNGYIGAEFSCIKKCKYSSDILLGGNYGQNLVYGTLFQRIDTGGSTIFLDTTKTNFDRFGLTDILEYDHHKYALCGVYGAYGFPYPPQGSFVLFTDRVDTFNLYTNLDTINNQMLSIFETNGKIYSNQMYQLNNNSVFPNQFPSCLIFDSTGTFINRKPYFVFNLYDHNVMIAKNSMQNILGVTDEIYLAEFDNNCDTIGVVKDSTYLRSFTSVIADDQKRIVACGYWKDQPGMPYISYIVRYKKSSFTSINEISKNASTLNVYPNPSLGIFKIETSGFNYFNSYKVFNNLGLAVAQGSIGENEIDLSFLCSGLYSIEFIDTINHQFVMKRVLIIK